MDRYEETHIGELVEKVKLWKQNCGDYPTREELINALDAAGWVDVDQIIEDAALADVVKVVNRVELTSGGHNE